MLFLLAYILNTCERTASLYLPYCMLIHRQHKTTVNHKHYRRHMRLSSRYLQYHKEHQNDLSSIDFIENAVGMYHPFYTLPLSRLQSTTCQRHVNNPTHIKLTHLDLITRPTHPHSWPLRILRAFLSIIPGIADTRCKPGPIAVERNGGNRTRVFWILT